MEGLFGYSCCALLLSQCISFTSIVVFAIFIAFWEWVFFFFFFFFLINCDKKGSVLVLA
jgi:hypothetical protein